MNKVYNFVGGRKLFYGVFCIAVLYFAAGHIGDSNYITFANGLIFIYASMVLGNVGSKIAYNMSTKNNTKEEENGNTEGTY